MVNGDAALQNLTFYVILGFQEHSYFCVVMVMVVVMVVCGVHILHPPAHGPGLVLVLVLVVVLCGEDSGILDLYLQMKLAW